MFTRQDLTKYVNEINNIKNNQYLIITCNKANSIVNPDYHLFTNRKRLLTSEIKWKVPDIASKHVIR